ncbi:MAG: hypothetical protein AABW80_03325 [Nanoarchaeota archaeon]
MGVLEEVQRLRSEGRQDTEIYNSLQSRGYSLKQINEALEGAAIKQAVSPDQGSSIPPAPSPSRGITQEVSDMQPSMMEYPQQPEQESYPANQEYSQQQEPYPSETYASDQYSQQGQQGYADYSGLSAETISEIADQAVSEKFNFLRAKIEKISSFKATAETKLETLEERLKRIEKIIDQLQLSILQKVGDSITNIADIKKELLETQKSFKAVKESRHKSHPQHSEHQVHHESHPTHHASHPEHQTHNHKS